MSDSPTKPPAGSLAPIEPAAPSPRDAAEDPSRLPFGTYSKLVPIACGMVFGLLLRLAFSGAPSSRWSAMVGAFIWLAPLATGAITVYLAERQQRRSWAYYAWAPALATLLVVIGSLLVLIEGLICAIVIVPLFTFMGMAGGLCMGLVCRLTRWPRHAAYGFAVLPLAAALVLPQGAPAQVGQVERSLWINAPAAVVWQGINDIRNIQPSEVETSLAYRIGVPPPVEAVTVQEPHGTHVRKIRWGKGVNFDEVIQDWEPGRHLRWTFRFGPDSIPAGALDDHVAIGGAYFDLNDTAYTLTPEAGGTRLHLRISYRLSTDFNTYANWWAQALLDNFALTVLQLYKTRLEGSA